MGTHTASAGGGVKEEEQKSYFTTVTLQLLDQLFERQFILSPWVREKRMRNQLRLLLKDHLDAGPKRRSTVTKVVHDAHQIFPVWRNQIREKVRDVIL